MNDRHSDADGDRYVLTELGMRYLAARAGTPPGTFARHGGVTFVEPDESEHPERVLRHREHTIGVNRFFALLAEDARRAGWHLEEWRNEAESTHRFVDQDVSPAWIRPDGAGVLRRGAESHPFLLEYDRGTLDAGDYRAKFEGYRRYYGSEAWLDRCEEEPALLFVCSDSRAAARVSHAARHRELEIPLLITTESGSARSERNHEGLLGDIWRRRVPGGGQIRWPGAAGSDASRRPV